MALLSYIDFERQVNVTLTDPDGRNLADTIANAIVAWSERYCGRHWTQDAYLEYFDGGKDRYWLANGPVATSPDVAVSLYNWTTQTYDAYAGTTRLLSDGSVRFDVAPLPGEEVVQIAYTGGYYDATADEGMPDDLKQAMTELLAQKFDAAQSGDKTVIEVASGDYREKYDLTTKDIPADILEVFDSHRHPIVL